MNVGSKSITAQRQRIRDKRRQRADKNKRIKQYNQRGKTFFSVTFDAKPLIDALKNVSEIFKTTFEEIKVYLSKVFPIPAMLNLYLQLQLADNTRPNMYLVGWGRLE